MTPQHEMELNSFVLRDLKATYVLTRDRREHKNYILRIKYLENLVTEHKIKLVSTKETISYRGAKSFVSIFLGKSPTFIAIPYFSFVSYYRGF